MDSDLQDLADKAIRHAIESGAEYCDARAEQQETNSVLIENGEIEHVRNNNDIIILSPVPPAYAVAAKSAGKANLR